jgi:hypothetical protein
MDLKVLKPECFWKETKESHKNPYSEKCVFDETGHRQLSNTTQIRYPLHQRAPFVIYNFPSSNNTYHPLRK